jgi:UDP-glucose 4-epimerase
MNNVLVSGGAGFIGSNTVDYLIERGYSVSVIDDLSTGKRENLNPKAGFFQADITGDVRAVFEKARPDVVMHMAAHIDVRKSLSDPAYDARANVLGTINMLEASRQSGVGKFVYISSGGAVYGEPVKNPVDESHPIAPLSPYGASKYAGEKYVQLYGRTHGLDYNILRYGNVFGPRQDPLGEAGVIAIFTGLLTGNKPPTIFGDGRQTRDFAYVSDIASANLLALECRGKSRVYNIGSGIATSVNDITEKLIKATGATVKACHGPPVAGEVRHIHLDISLAGKELGFKPNTSVDEGIGKTVGWVTG